MKKYCIVICFAVLIGILLLWKTGSSRFREGHGGGGGGGHGGGGHHGGGGGHGHGGKGYYGGGGGGSGGYVHGAALDFNPIIYSYDDLDGMAPVILYPYYPNTLTLFPYL